MSEPFKVRMKRLRKQAGFESQAAAAVEIGCERGTVGMWEAPSSQVGSVGAYLLAVARAYRVRPEYVETGEGDDGFPWEAESPPAPSPASQSATLDAGKLQTSTEFVDRQLDLLELEASDQSRYLMIAAAYSWLIAEPSPNWVDLSRRLIDLVKERPDVRQRKAGSAR